MIRSVPCLRNHWLCKIFGHHVFEYELERVLYCGRCGCIFEIGTVKIPRKEEEF